jgi:hypothetical protein
VLRASIAAGTLLFSCGAVSAADNASAAQWTAQVTPENCLLTGALTDPGGNAAGKIEIKLGRSGYYTLTISISNSAPLAYWRFEDVADLNERLAYQPSAYRHITIGGDAGERARREVAEGRALSLLPRPGVDRHRLTTGTRGAADSLQVFDQCVANFKANPEPPPHARWATGTQGGRDCTLRLSDISGVRGLDIYFGARHKLTLTFDVTAEENFFKSGGILKIGLPGDPNPYTYDTAVRTAKRDPRSPAVYAAIRRNPVDMTFTPHGGKSIALRTATEGLAVAGAMFDACAKALSAETLPEQASFSELRHTVNEVDDSCELTATQQIEGNAIWLTLLSDGKKNTMKVTRRTVGNGRLIQEMKLANLGGPEKTADQDVMFELDQAQFAALRRDLVGKGRDYRVAMNSQNGYIAKFGGPHALIEAPMFEACAHSKFDTR